MSAPITSERAAVQNPLLRYAVDAGWEYIAPGEALRLRRGEDSPLLWDVFVRKAQDLNPAVVDHLKAEELAKRLARVPPSREGNLDAWEYLRGLKTTFVEAERRERNVPCLISKTGSAILFKSPTSSASPTAPTAFAPTWFF